MFLLSKWYMDVVSADGRCCVGYHAALRWNKLKLHYYHLLVMGSDGKVQGKGGFTREPEPQWENGVLRWQAKGIEAEWRSAQEPLEENLLRTAKGTIDWLCRQPKAKAQLRVLDEELEGWGYTERLELSIPPWELPIRELRWGRFISENHSITWIDWQGELPRAWVFHNGLRCEALEFSEGEMRNAQFRLRHSDDRALRSGALLSTVFRPFQSIKRIIPLKALRTEEYKWRSKGRLELPNGETESGWMIHELVRWV